MPLRAARLHGAHVVDAAFSLMADTISTLLRRSCRNDNQTLATTRTLDPDIKRQLDAVMIKTAKLDHYFWTGWTLPGTWNTTSVKDLAGDYARAHGGTTVGDAIKNIKMPFYDPCDKAATDLWEYASEEFARHAEGDVYLIHGGDARAKGVWTDFEFPRLKQNNEVSRILRINMHAGGKTDKEIQIWPDCAELVDKKPTCPAGAKLHHGSTMNKPRITAKTTLRKDGRVVVAKGTASRMSRGCNKARSRPRTRNGAAQSSAGSAIQIASNPPVAAPAVVRMVQKCCQSRCQGGVSLAAEGHSVCPLQTEKSRGGSSRMNTVLYSCAPNRCRAALAKRRNHL